MLIQEIDLTTWGHLMLATVAQRILSFLSMEENCKICQPDICLFLFITIYEATIVTVEIHFLGKSILKN